MFDDAFAVAVVRNGDRTTFDSWATATEAIQVGDQVRAFMSDGTTRYAVVVPRTDDLPGEQPWKTVLLPW